MTNGRAASRRAVGIGVAGALLCMAAPAAAKRGGAGIQKRLEAATDLYHEGRYDEAIEKLDELLARPKLKEATRVQALKFKAFSYLLQAKNTDARAVWLELLGVDAAFELDPVEVSPEFIEFFAGVRREWESGANEAPPPGDPTSPSTEIVEETAGGPTEPVDPVEPVETIEAQPLEDAPVATDEPAIVEATDDQCHPVVCLLPFGIGQFANGNVVKGVIFMAAEAIFLGLNIGLFWHNKSQLGPDELPTDEDAHNRTFILQNVFFGVFVGTAVVGIIDAFVWP